MYKNIEMETRVAEAEANLARFADVLSAMGTEPRLHIMRLLLSARPVGMVVGEIGEKLGIPNSTQSHHLDKLKNEGVAADDYKTHIHSPRLPSSNVPGSKPL